MIRSIGLLILSFISSFGDTVFLVGLPIFFYKAGGDSFIDATYVSIVINLTVFVARKQIISIQSSNNPVKTVAIGEISMALLELVFLLFYLYFEWKWLLLLAVVPLAFAYNLYAVPKFYQIQDYFHSGDLVKYTALQTFAREAGVVVGILTAGYLMQNHSIKEVMAIDIGSFLFFGLGLLIFAGNCQKQAKTKNAESNLKKAGQNINLRDFIIISTIASFLLAWQQSSSLSTLNYAYSMPFDTASQQRSIFGTVGLIAGLLLIMRGNFQRWSLWKAHAIFLSFLVSLLSIFYPTMAIILLFLLLGSLKSFTDASKKECYMRFESEGKFPKLASIQWTTETLFKTSLIPLALIADKFFKSTDHLLPLYISSVFILSYLAGTFNYRYIKSRYYA